MTTTRFESLRRRFGDTRPGLQLLAADDAALPVTLLRVDVLAQARRKLPVTEEFVLRFVEQGVDSPTSIANYLGLDAGHVVDAVAAQLSEVHLKRSGGGALQLTAQGREVVRDLAATHPVSQQLPVAFDRITWAPANYPERDLIEKKVAEERGMLVLPAAKSATIASTDVSPSAMNALFRDERVQVLRVHGLKTRKHLYLPVKILIFADTRRGEVELAVLIDDDLSDLHETALAAVNATEKLGITLSAPEPRPVLDEDLEALRTNEQLEDIGDSHPASANTIPVRSVSVHEHADLLREALDSTTRRLLIISPWVKGGVVNRDFCERLERRIRAGVAVTIAHGIGDDDRGSDPWALDRLQKLAARYERFDFVRLRNTHAKILISDDVWISTSFNWLSFRGDRDRTYRMEEGTLVGIQARVDREYERYLEMIRAQRSAP